MSEANPALTGLQLPAEVCALLVEVFPRAGCFSTAMSVIERVRQAVQGDGLLTVNKVSKSESNADEFELHRMWSSASSAYPVAGLKRKTLTPWSRQVLLRCEVFVGEGDDALAGAFDDHARIADLGLHAVVNVPLVVENRCVATLNVLSCHEQWQPPDVTLIRLLAVLATPWVLQLVDR